MIANNVEDVQDRFAVVAIRVITAVRWYSLGIAIDHKPDEANSED